MLGTSRLFVLFVALLFGCAAQAGDVVMTLSATGEIEIGPDGRVLSHRLDDSLQAPIAAAIARNVETWTFEPVIEDGRPVIAVTRMHLTLEAIEQSRDAVALRVARVWFGDTWKAESVTPPRYPGNAVRARVEAQVVIAIKLDPEGRVVEAHPYQTSFAAGADGRVAKRYRSAFEQASLSAVRTWKYAPIPGQRGVQMALVPITFLIGRDAASWSAWTPGPITPAPWQDDRAGESAALPKAGEGVALATDERIRLKTDAVGSLL